MGLCCLRPVCICAASVSPLLCKDSIIQCVLRSLIEGSAVQTQTDTITLEQTS